MADFVSNPTVFFGIIGACVLVGILLGLKMQRRTDEEALKKLAFQAGRKEGLREGDEILRQFKDDMAGDLGSQLGEMRSGMIQTIKAYQHAVATCGERLSIPLEQRKELLPPVEPHDISEEVEAVEEVEEIEVAAGEISVEADSSEKGDSAQEDTEQEDQKPDLKVVGAE